jgi:hypothetical protein
MIPILDEVDKDIHITGCYKTHPTARSYYARSGRIYVHRIVMQRILGTNIPSGSKVDHINGNGLDCRRSNLRLVTHAQNLANRPGWKTSSSKFKGVTFNKQRQLWQSKITVSAKTKHLGYFANEIDAAKAYDSAAKELFRDCAYTNFKESA